MLIVPVGLFAGVVPSPKSSVQFCSAFSGSVHVPVNVTVSGAVPLIGFAFSVAVGGWFVNTFIVALAVSVCGLSSVAVSVVVYVLISA